MIKRQVLRHGQMVNSNIISVDKNVVDLFLQTDLKNQLHMNYVELRLYIRNKSQNLKTFEET